MQENHFPAKKKSVYCDYKLIVSDYGYQAGETISNYIKEFQLLKE